MQEGSVNFHTASVYIFPKLGLLAEFCSGLYAEEEDILPNRASDMSLPETSRAIPLPPAKKAHGAVSSIGSWNARGRETPTSSSSSSMMNSSSPEIRGFRKLLPTP